MKILITGGLGYIGSHIAVKLLENDHEVVIIDNLSNSSLDTIKSIELITGRRVEFYNLDIRSIVKLSNIFEKNKFDAVIHFAGKKSIEESILNPIDYFENNINGSLNLVGLMSKYGCFNLIFSSSATVYGVPLYLPIDENHPKNPINPYGTSKLICEKLFEDICNYNKKFNIIALRYFNPVGSHSSYRIGENTQNKAYNLFPILNKVANKQQEKINIYGNDYPTRDGSGVRDYIHIDDLTDGHYSTLKKLESKCLKGFSAFNLGTGTGYSVLEVIKEFENSINHKINIEFTKKRDGDVAEVYADVTLAGKILEWNSKKNLKEMCLSSWNYSCNNKNDSK